MNKLEILNHMITHYKHLPINEVIDEYYAAITDCADSAAVCGEKTITVDLQEILIWRNLHMQISVQLLPYVHLGVPSILLKYVLSAFIDDRLSRSIYSTMENILGVAPTDYYTGPFPTFCKREANVFFEVAAPYTEATGIARRHTVRRSSASLEHYKQSYGFAYSEPFGMLKFLNENGWKCLRQFTWYIKLRYPQVIEAPMITQLTAFLLFYLPRDLAYSIVVSLLMRDTSASLTGILPTSRELRARTTSYVTEYVKVRCKSVHRHITKHCQFDFERWTEKFLANGNVKHTPYDLIYRMYTSYALDGVGIFIRYALALLLHYKNSLLTTVNAHEVCEILNFHGITKLSLSEISNITALAFKYPLDEVPRATVISNVKSAVKQLLSSTMSEQDTISFDVIPNIDDEDSEEYMPRSSEHFRPRLMHSSSFIDDHGWVAFWSHMPPTHRSLEPRLSFSTNLQGCNHRRLYEHMHASFILAIKLRGNQYFMYFSPSSYDDRSVFIFVNNYDVSHQVFNETWKPKVKYEHKLISLGKPPLMIISDCLSHVELNRSLIPNIHSIPENLDIISLELWNLI